MPEDQSVITVDPALKLNFLSHGTLICRDLDVTRKFYEEFFGLDIVRTSPISLMIRLGGSHTYAAVEQKRHTAKMEYLYHNGLDVSSPEDVDEAYKTTLEQAEKWSLTGISKPVKQHGTYSFYFWDVDLNCWEILSNPEGGYGWLFERGEQDGKGHLDKNFKRPGFDD